MKLAIVMALSMFSMSAFAFLTEVECETEKNGKTYYVEVEEAFPSGSYFKRAKVEVNSAEEGTKSFDYTVTTRRSGGLNRLNYNGGGLRLEVDLWPDNAPRWGRTYRGILSSRDLDNKHLQVDCRYPHVF